MKKNKNCQTTLARTMASPKEKKDNEGLEMLETSSELRLHFPERLGDGFSVIIVAPAVKADPQLLKKCLRILAERNGHCRLRGTMKYYREESDGRIGARVIKGIGWQEVQVLGLRRLQHSKGIRAIQRRPKRGRRRHGEST